MYLKEDFTGPASRIQYGKAGDAVEVVSIEGNMALVKGGRLFHIRVEKLGEEKPEKIEITNHDPIKSVPVEKPKKKKPIPKQKSLF